MQRFNEKLLFNLEHTFPMLEKSIYITEILGKLSVRMKDTFLDYKKASRIFAYIESKYSSKIEGIYTTLFDVVNTGAETKQQKLIRPIVMELFKSKDNISLDRLVEISTIMNTNIDKSKRFDKDFGIYKQTKEKKVKIYEPPLDEAEIKRLFKKVIDKSKQDRFIHERIHTHILFEKVHPFVDANGRLGRLLLQKQVAQSMNFSNVIPISWAFFTNLSSYYDSFDINNRLDLQKGV